MGLSVNRYFKQCDLCGGKIQVDTMQYPGEGEDAPAVLEDVESHLGSCTPKPADDVSPEQAV